MLISPRPFGQVLADAVNSLGRIWRSMLFPALAVSIPVSIATAVVFRVTGGSDFLELIFNSPENLAGLPSEIFWELARPFYVALAIATVLQILAGVFVALASHGAVAADLRGEPLNGGDVSRLALKRYPVGVGSTVLIVLSVAVLIALGTLLWLMPAVEVGTPNPGSVFVALLLFFALLGPGIWVAVSVSMTTSAIAIEDQGVLGSIRRSMRLVRGRWWATAGFLLLVGLLGGIAIQLIQLVALPLATVGDGGGALTIASALGVLTQGLLVAAIAAMYTHWYIDLRARREGLTTSDLG
ncbi:MAG TPA: hypothetical protein VFZ80_03275 [Acidimicrobiia bacterium]